MESPQVRYRFSNVTVDVSNLRLTVSGETRPLEPKSFRLLQFLIENRHRVVPKNEILSVVWDEVAVSDNALTRAVALIRKALGDDPRQPRYIETIPTVGYRFTGALIEHADPLLTPPPPQSRRPRLRWAIAALFAIVGILGARSWWANSPKLPRSVTAIRQITKSAAADLWPSFSPDGSQLAFSSNRTGQYEIYVRSLAADGAERQLTADGEENTQPAWSPDGKYLAYVPRQHGGIKIIPISGGPARYLTETGDSPQWAPNGGTLVIREFGRNMNPVAETTPPDSGAAILALMDFTASGPAVALTNKNTPAPNPSSPRWLPDGRHVVFHSLPPRSTPGLWIADSASRRLQVIHVGTRPQFPVFSPDRRDLYFADEAATVAGIWRARTGRDWSIESAEPLIPSEGSSARDLTISADGSRIAFSRQNGESAMWSVSVDSAGAPVSEPRPFFRDRSYRNTEPHFSADGSKIVWTSTAPGYSQVIYVANADGSSPVAVTPADQNSSRPQWVGNDYRLAYRVQKNGKWSYWVGPLLGRPERVNTSLDLDHADRIRLSRDGTMMTAQVIAGNGLRVIVAGLHGGVVRTLTPADRNIGFPCWSPDARLIAAEEQVGSTTALVAFPSHGGEIRTVAREFAQYFPYDWSPDSKRIVFAGLQNGVWNIYWISVATGHVEQLTHLTGQSGFVRYPSWSPKGDRIVFERNDLTSNIFVADLISRDRGANQ